MDPNCVRPHAIELDDDDCARVFPGNYDPIPLRTAQPQLRALISWGHNRLDQVARAGRTGEHSSLKGLR